MRKAQSTSEAKIDRPRRVVITRKEALKRMKEFSRRRERFIATVRTSKSGVKILNASSFLRNAVLDSIQAKTLQLIEAGT